MNHIFISYSRKDKKVVSQFVESLRKQDFIIWQDVSNIAAGDKWHQALLDAIEQAAALLVFWTQSASNSTYVNEEIEHALKNNKVIIPVWLESATPLREGLKESNAVPSSGFSSGAVQKISHALLKYAPRIQRQIMDVSTSLPMNSQTVPGITREVIGTREYVIVPLVKSVYSNAHLIAEAGTILRQVTRIQLIVQNTGAVDFTTVRDAFRAVLATDAEHSDEAEPLVGLYITGAQNPMDPSQYWVDSTNVAHYSDVIDTTRKAISSVSRNAAETQTFQLFQKTLVDIAFLLGASLDRWLSLQLFKWDGGQYIRIMDIPPRVPS